MTDKTHCGYTLAWVFLELHYICWWVIRDLAQWICLKKNRWVWNFVSYFKPEKLVHLYSCRKTILFTVFRLFDEFCYHLLRFRILAEASLIANQKEKCLESLRFSWNNWTVQKLSLHWGSAMRIHMRKNKDISKLKGKLIFIDLSLTFNSRKTFYEQRQPFQTKLNEWIFDCLNLVKLGVWLWQKFYPSFYFSPYLVGNTSMDFSLLELKKSRKTLNSANNILRNG